MCSAKREDNNSQYDVVDAPCRAALDAAPVRMLAMDNLFVAALEPGLTSEDKQFRQQRKVNMATYALRLVAVNLATRSSASNSARRDLELRLMLLCPAPGEDCAVVAHTPFPANAT